MRYDSSSLKYFRLLEFFGMMNMKDELQDLIQHESYGDVLETLQFLFEECSLDEAPSKSEVMQWAQWLQQRGGKFLKLAQMCQDYIQENP